jgi:ubiquinone/menaquinone biosynthesis C-methylase UbiE
MTENDPLEYGHTYVMDTRTSAEMARLVLQDRMITEGMHGIFSERSDLENIHAILDVGCGPGGWALDVAHTYPDRRIVGIDIGAAMVTYAQARATAQRLSNVTFLVMNALEPFDFAEGTFDLVNVRAAVSWVLRKQWPTFLQHCFSVLRPGGILRLTEAETVGLSNSATYEKMGSLGADMLYRRGYGFSPDGSHLGILPMLGLLLQEVGCVNIQFKPHILDYSTGTALHESQYQNFMVGSVVVKPVILREGKTTEEEYDALYKQVLEDLQLPNFRGLWSFLTVWGEKRA